MIASPTRAGALFAIVAFSAWGLLPLYWRQLAAVPSFEVIGHRAVWSLLFLSLFCYVRGMIGELGTIAKTPKKVAMLALTGSLMASNWSVYVWAVTNGQLVEASLGYFLSPLATIALGALVFHEHLSTQKKIAVALASVGVLLKTVSAGTAPWLGLSLAASMSLYGCLQKRCGVSALPGVTVETALMAPIALVYLSYLSLTSESHFLSEGLSTTLLLCVTGVASSLPLIWYVRASQLLPLSTLGIVAYLAPTLQFLLAVMVFKEPMSISAYVSFFCIWTAIALYLWGDMSRRFVKAPEAV